MAPATTTSPAPGAPAAAPAPGEMPALPIVPGLDREGLQNLLQHMPPHILKQLADNKEDPGAAINALVQHAAMVNAANGVPLPPGAIPAPPGGGFPSIADPGPSSHPRGPPNLGQLSQIAMQAQAAAAAAAGVGAVPPPPGGSQDEDDGDEKKDKPAGASGGRRGGRGGAAMGSEEWARQRKDNHKEVERRRRGNINEGINELGRIVPSGSGEKAKGAILSRAVQYIHHLKENEARNIEKWTLEKLLMDQAMGDLQAQLEEVRRMWEEERSARQRLETELEVLRGGGTSGAGAGTTKTNGVKRSGDESEGEESKRMRTE